MSKESEVFKSPKKLDPELGIKERSNAEKMLIKKLKERKKAYKKFLSQIDDFIEYAKDQAKNNSNVQLRLKYLETMEEEVSLRDKIKEYLNKNDELMESIQKLNYNPEE